MNLHGIAWFSCDMAIGYSIRATALSIRQRSHVARARLAHLANIPGRPAIKKSYG